MAHTDEDALMRNVADLRTKLIRTERNLHLLQTPGHDRRNRYKHVVDPEEQLPPLTLDDLTPEHLASSMSSLRSGGSNYSMNKGMSRAVFSHEDSGRTSHREECEEESDFQTNPSMSSLANSPTLQETSENRRLRRRLQALREDNSLLVTKNHGLQSKIENCQYELRITKGQMKAACLHAQASKSEAAILEENCDSLRTELKANDSALRMAERSLEESGRQLTERVSSVQKHRQEMARIRAELAEEQQLRARMESQRDETAQTLEELSEQLEQSRAETREQLASLSTVEEHLRGSLAHCDREREELLERATSLEEELQDSRDHVRSLQEASTRLSHADSALKQSRQESEERDRRIQHLETEVDAKQGENQELRELTERQSERLVDCQRDIENSSDQLRRLEGLVQRTRQREGHSGSIERGHAHEDNLSSLLSGGVGVDSGFEADTLLGTGQSHTVISELGYQLAVRDVEIQRLKSATRELPTRQASTASLPEVGGTRSPTGLRAQLAALMEKSKLGEKKTQELENLIGRLNSELAKRTSEAGRLRQELAGSEAGRSSAESRMSLRDGQLTQLHAEVQGQASRIADLEKELKKGEGQIKALESQLGEKTSTFSSHVARLEELQTKLETKTSQLEAAKEELRKRELLQDRRTAEVEQILKLNKEQGRELHQQLDMMQQQRDQKAEELKSLGEAQAGLQREVDQKEERLSRLQSDLAESQKEVIRKSVENQQLWNTVQSNVDEGTLRLVQMEAALEVCKQELTMSIAQAEDVQKGHDNDLQLKDKEVADLEERWRKAVVEMEERGLRAAELEQALREGQQMLQQSTVRIGELEDREGQLDHQVSALAKESSRLRTAAVEEAEAMARKLHQACVDLEDRSQELGEATRDLSAVQSELAQSKAAARDSEQKLREARRDGDNLLEKTSQLEAELHATKVKLEDSESKVKEEEEVLERTRKESRQTGERCRHLDAELQQAQEELRGAAAQLGELHRLLQRSRAENKLKQERVQELHDSLRKSAEEARSKERDVAELDLALRTSQRELLQRSAQVSQLDVTVKERQSDMERQILHLETSLNKSQYELKQCRQKIVDLEESREKHSQDDHKRALRIQDLEQAVQRRSNDVALKTKQVAHLERRIEELTKDMKDTKEEYLDQGQQLRLSREQAQQSHVKTAELQRHLAEAQRQQDHLSCELEESLAACRAKDSELAELAEDLGSTRAQELALQTQYASELQQIARLRDTEVELKKDEVAQLRENHAQLLTSRDQMESAHRLEMGQLKEAKQEAALELGGAMKHVADLEADLAASREVVKATNEAIVIKESEIARLKAKVSGYERALLGSQLSSHCQMVSPQCPATSDRTLSPSSMLQELNLHHQLSSVNGRSNESPTRGDVQWALLDRPLSLPHSDRPTECRDRIQTDSSDKPGAGDSSNTLPGPQNPMLRMDEEDRFPSRDGPPSHDAPQVRFRVDAFSDITETNSVISGIERLPEGQQNETHTTFQAMLEFVNRQITTESGHTWTAKDTNWLNSDDTSCDSLLLTPTHSWGTSTNATSSLSPPTPLKGRDRSPSSRSAPPTPSSPRRKSGIPLRKVSSPGRRALHFSKGGSSQTSAMHARGGKSKGRKSQQSKSSTNRPEKDTSSPETTPLKQKLSNQRAKLLTRGTARSGDSSTFEPKKCIADLKAQLQANDVRRQQIDQELFGITEK